MKKYSPTIKFPEGIIPAYAQIVGPRAKRTESVKRHRRWQARIDKDTFFDGVFNLTGTPRL